METMILETPPRTTDIAHMMPKMRVAVHIDAEVLDAEIARRKANVWLLKYAGNLLGAKNPELILQNRLIWRVDVVLATSKRGQIGKVGQLQIDALTGEIISTENLVNELLSNADALVAS